MSTTMNTTSYLIDNVADASASGKAAQGKSVYQKVIDSRTRQAAQHVASYLQRQSDASLAGLGFTPAEVAEIRLTGIIPVSFWR